VIAPVPPQTVSLSNALVFTVTATDPVGGDPITLGAINLPLGAAFGATNGTGTFSWPSAAPTGVYTVAFTATDIAGITTQAVTLTVTEAAGPPVTNGFGACSLILSELVEGSSLNKAIELYNGTDAAIDLGAGGYAIEMYFNDNTTVGTTINLTGTIPAGGVYVLGHSSAGTAIQAEADQLEGGSWFNGNDLVVLRRGGEVVDSAGQLGAGTLYNEDLTLSRRPWVVTGDTNLTDNFVLIDEWVEFPENTFSGLGSHVMDCPDDPDSDGDGVPDAIEEGLFGNLATITTTSDFDLDGVTDLHEYLSGTNLEDPASHLRVDESRLEASVGVVIQWPGVTGKTYRITRSTNLAQTGYSVLASNQPGISPVSTWTDAVPAGAAGAYRIELEP
jgi:hypothetical protein